MLAIGENNFNQFQVPERKESEYATVTQIIF